MGWQGFGRGFGMMGHMWGLGGGHILGAIASLFGFLFFLGLLALIALAVVWLVRRSRTTASVTAGGPGLSGSPLDVAKRRLAAGEITLDEYHRIRDELQGS